MTTDRWGRRQGGGDGGGIRSQGTYNQAYLSWYYGAQPWDGGAPRPPQQQQPPQAGGKYLSPATYSAAAVSKGFGRSQGGRSRTPDGAVLIRRKSPWKNFPELENFLAEHREEYVRISTNMNYTPEQRRYNDELTKKMLDLAARCGYAFDERDYGFVAVRERIRCYYKSARRREKSGDSGIAGCPAPDHDPARDTGPKETSETDATTTIATTGEVQNHQERTQDPQRPGKRARTEEYSSPPLSEGAAAPEGQSRPTNEVQSRANQCRGVTVDEKPRRRGDAPAGKVEATGKKKIDSTKTVGDPALQTTAAAAAVAAAEAAAEAGAPGSAGGGSAASAVAKKKTTTRRRRREGILAAPPPSPPLPLGKVPPYPNPPAASFPPFGSPPPPGYGSPSPLGYQFPCYPPWPTPAHGAPFVGQWGAEWPPMPWSPDPPGLPPPPPPQSYSALAAVPPRGGQGSMPHSMVLRGCSEDRSRRRLGGKTTSAKFAFEASGAGSYPGLSKAAAAAAAQQPRGSAAEEPNGDVSLSEEEEREKDEDADMDDDSSASDSEDCGRGRDKPLMPVNR